jgi:hypothetical protein
VKVYFNIAPRKDSPRKLVEVKLVRDFKTTMLVELPDGTIVLRKKNRDLPKEVEK